MHLSRVIPANDTRESMFGHPNFFSPRAGIEHWTSSTRGKWEPDKTSRDKTSHAIFWHPGQNIPQRFATPDKTSHAVFVTPDITSHAIFAAPEKTSHANSATSDKTSHFLGYLLAKKSLDKSDARLLVENPFVEHDNSSNTIAGRKKTAKSDTWSILFLSEVRHLVEKKSTKCRTLLHSKQVSKYFTWHRSMEATVKRAIQRERRKKIPERSPKSLSDLKIPDEWRTTSKGDYWLLADISLAAVLFST